MFFDKITQMTYYMAISSQNCCTTLIMCIMSTRISGKEKSFAFVFAHISYNSNVEKY